MVCAPSTLLQLYVVPDTRQGAQRFAQRGVPGALVYFGTFEPINLAPGSIMQRAGVPMLYDSASNPRLIL